MWRFGDPGLGLRVSRSWEMDFVQGLRFRVQSSLGVSGLGLEIKWVAERAMQQQGCHIWGVEDGYK